VSTTFDSLLAQALDEERHGGAPKTTSLAYAPNHNQDLPPDAGRAATPTVFHLLGRMSASSDYVITEEDTLEFDDQRSNGSDAKPEVKIPGASSGALKIVGADLPRDKSASKCRYRGVNPLLHPTKPKQASGYRTHRE
jgi:hypothetical protein